MGCKSKPCKSCSRSSGKSKSVENVLDKFTFRNLKEKGRLQYFFHSPSSKLPIRDVLNEQDEGHKTEPHIEIGAENYISCCYQSNNIIPFLKSKEKYLFLFTTCKNKELDPCKNKELDHKRFMKTAEGKKNKKVNYHDERFIVGYIMKQDFIDCNGHYAARGSTKLYSFSNSYPLKRLFRKHKNLKNIRIKCLSEVETGKIRDHFKGKHNKLLDCVNEIKRLDKKNKKSKKTCLLLRRKHGKCEYQNDCLRWKK